MNRAENRPIISPTCEKHARDAPLSESAKNHGRALNQRDDAYQEEKAADDQSHEAFLVEGRLLSEEMDAVAPIENETFLADLKFNSSIQNERIA